MFLILLVVGLVGLGVMALPAIGRHHGGGLGHVAKLGHAAKLGPGHGVALARTAPGPLALNPVGVTRFLPSPRLVFSLLALYGAFGNLLVAVDLASPWAELVAIVPAALVERFAVTPLWRQLFALDGRASAPLEELVLADATAVTAFRGGRGIVSVVRDGRLVQFSARLADAQRELPVRVGDHLRVEDVDAARERVTVSIVRESV